MHDVSGLLFVLATLGLGLVLQASEGLLPPALLAA